LENYDFKQIKYESFLINLGNHCIFALIALIAIGSATRVMEAGLACPDWPLCYGSFLPLSKMNTQVFLEWFHRLDAFLVGLLITAQFSLSIIWRKYLPNWLPKIYSVLVFLIILQGSLGAFTVIKLLDSITVISHLFIAFLILITSISITQNLHFKSTLKQPKWWKMILFCPLLLTIIQSIIGARLSSTWSAHLCLAFDQSCLILNTHKLFAIPLTLSIISILIASFHNKTLFIKNWRYLISLPFILLGQITLGIFSLKTNLDQPFIIVFHQIFSSLLISTLAALFFREPISEVIFESTNKKITLGYNS
tara:strand:+ start:1080 stop:2006 length:927 start_codon:yes stop_codon:yes gene_type:complete